MPETRRRCPALKSVSSGLMGDRAKRAAGRRDSQDDAALRALAGEWVEKPESLRPRNCSMRFQTLVESKLSTEFGSEYPMELSAAGERSAAIEDHRVRAVREREGDGKLH